jgi:hypothetical protein
LFDVVGEKLEAQSPNDTWTKDMMQVWRYDTRPDVHNSSRHQCFAEVEARADVLLSENRTFLDEFYSTSFWDGVSVGTVSWLKALVNHFCSLPAKRLAQVLRNFQQEYFILAFDECADLDDPWTYPDGKGMSLVALIRLFHVADALCVGDFTFWFLLLRRKVTIHHMSAESPFFSSPWPAYPVLPPWTYLGFNQMVGRRHSVDIRRPSDALSMQHLKAYGRPVGDEVFVSKLLAQSVLVFSIGAAFRINWSYTQHTKTSLPVRDLINTTNIMSSLLFRFDLAWILATAMRQGIWRWKP